MTLRTLFIALLMCLFAISSYAEFEMTPGIDLSLEYDDNIFLDPDNEEDDVITTVTPNISDATMNSLRRWLRRASLSVASTPAATV